MTATIIKLPGFRPTQRVSFVGGEGTIQSYRPEAGTWAYLVKMAFGPEPDCGRIGAETMVVLIEAELCST
jgi:hypothetical protein